MNRCFGYLEEHLKASDGRQSPFDAMLEGLASELQERFKAELNKLMAKMKAVIDKAHKDLVATVQAEEDAAVLAMRSQLKVSQADLLQYVSASDARLKELEEKYAVIGELDEIE